MVVPQKVLAARLGHSLSHLNSARRLSQSNRLLQNSSSHRTRHNLPLR